MSPNMCDRACSTIDAAIAREAAWHEQVTLAEDAQTAAEAERDALDKHLTRYAEQLGERGAEVDALQTEVAEYHAYLARDERLLVSRAYAESVEKERDALKATVARVQELAEEFKRSKHFVNIGCIIDDAIATPKEDGL